MKTILFTLATLILSVIATYILVPRPYMVHHHANFAVYIDGKQKDFSNDVYMEEVSRCNVTEGVMPQDRIHLHENQGDIVHVHMAASTWGDLFANLEWGMGSGYLVDDFGKIYTANGEKRLSYFINGEKVTNPQNMIVGSTDQLLVWYGTGSDEEIAKRSDTLVSQTAAEYNQKADPASCGSNEFGFLNVIAEPIHEFFEHHE